MIGTASSTEIAALELPVAIFHELVSVSMIMSFGRNINSCVYSALKKTFCEDVSVRRAVPTFVLLDEA